MIHILFCAVLDPIDHMLKCLYPTIKANWEEIYMQLMIKGKQQKIPKGILTVFVQALSKYTNVNDSSDHNTSNSTLAIKDVIAQQITIGVNMMAQGYIGKQWIEPVPISQPPPPPNNEQPPTHGMDGLF